MQQYRRKFIDQLRNNPDGRDQIECMLSNGHNGRCAMGLGLEGIGVTFNSDDPKDENDAYQRGALLLGFPDYPKNCDGFDLVWRLNDKGHTFAEIAEILEEKWQ